MDRLRIDRPGAVIPRIGGLRLEAVTTNALRDLYRSLAEPGVGRHGKGLAPHSVKHTYTFVNLVLEDALRLRVLKENPNKPIPRPKFERRDANHWTPTEAAEFLARTAADELWPAWVLLLTTGMRRGEILGLRWSDIDTERGAVRVRRNVVSAGYQVHEKEPKTATGRRRVALDSFTLAALREHRVRVEQRAVFVGRRVAHDEPVFLSAIGEPIHPMSFSRLFRDGAVRAGVRPISVKDGRHTSATLALVANTHPKVVSERLGHSDVQITMDVYSHVIEGLQRDAAEGIAALIRPPPVANDSDAETPSLDETTSAEAREAERLS